MTLRHPRFDLLPLPRGWCAFGCALPGFPFPQHNLVNINQARVKHDFETMVRRSMVAQSGVMGRKRPAASQMMPTDELDEPMELGAAAAAPAASTRAHHTLSGDDGAKEPSPTRRCLGGLEVGCPLALLKHSVEILQALATAASNAPDVRVPKKDVDRLYKYNDGGRWRRFFKADTTDSPVARAARTKAPPAPTTASTGSHARA